MLAVDAGVKLMSGYRIRNKDVAEFDEDTRLYERRRVLRRLLRSEPGRQEAICKWRADELGRRYSISA